MPTFTKEELKADISPTYGLPRTSLFIPSPKKTVDGKRMVMAPIKETE